VDFILHFLRQSLCILIGSVLFSTADAQAPSQSTQQSYERIRALEAIIGKLAVARALKTNGEAGANALIELGYSASDPVPSSESYETEKQGLLNLLEERGSKGDALAAFYTAMFAQEAAKHLALYAPTDASNKLFEKAVIFWGSSADQVGNLNG
jgi:hypothetical protein